jgi:hypothetical protein
VHGLRDDVKTAEAQIDPLQQQLHAAAVENARLRDLLGRAGIDPNLQES